MTWNVNKIVLQTEGIKGDIWMRAYKSPDKKELIITLANKEGVRFKLPKDAKALMDESRYSEPTN